MKFIELKEKYILKPIYGCPGRYILKLDTFISLKELVDEPENIKEYRLKTAEDTICNSGNIQLAVCPKTFRRRNR